VLKVLAVDFDHPNDRSVSDFSGHERRDWIEPITDSNVAKVSDLPCKISIGYRR
jgi:hypothetical protein